jgi:hypothetical protein
MVGAVTTIELPTWGISRRRAMISAPSEQIALDEDDGEQQAGRHGGGVRGGRATLPQESALATRRFRRRGRKIYSVAMAAYHGRFNFHRGDPT